jgi:N-acetylglucosaminyl-diphospho-decaprenol L-rhamnosyltransferase
MPVVSMSVIVVAYGSATDLEQSLPPLAAQLGPVDELFVVDNDPSRPVAQTVTRLAPEAQLLTPERNLGFAGGANLAATRAQGELIVLLNPDAVVQPGWAESMRETSDSGEWDGWMALVTLPGGAAINTSGGILHFTGLGWAGQAHEPVLAASTAESEVGFLSGACLAVRRSAWRSLGGLPGAYFMYCEDVDLSLRLRLRGGRLTVRPAARVEHAYEFAKGDWKWRMLERNRWATLVRTYPAALLVLLAPALLVAEMGIWLVALRQGWATMKARATRELIGWLPRLVAERRAIQRARTVDAATFAATLVSGLDSPYLGSVGRNQALAAALGGYWRVVQAVLAIVR